VTFLQVDEKNISDLTGIEDFKTVRTIHCHKNELTTLELNFNTNLKTLVCHNNKLTSLDLSNNPKLEFLYCRYNLLNRLDISKNINLSILSCSNNKLSDIDLSNNSDLEIFWCNNNNFSSFDLSNNSDLKSLFCSSNYNLKNLDLSNNENLGMLDCTNCNLISLDLSNNSSLTSMRCDSNKLISLDIRNGNNNNMITLGAYYFNASENPELTCIQVDDSAYSANHENWLKDDHAVYSEDCGYTGVKALNTFEPEISIFPNPADKNFTVSFELESPKTITMTLTDLSGIELQEYTLEHRQFVNEEIDVSGLSAGVYFLNISFGNGSLSRKIVVE